MNLDDKDWEKILEIFKHDLEKLQELEEEWTLAKKKENSTLDPKDTPPPWFLSPHSPEKIQEGKRLFHRNRQSPYPLDKYLIGFRGWIWDKHSQSLNPVGTALVPWPKGEPIHASCNIHIEHKAPEKGCYCGVWCFKDPKVLVTKVRHYFDTGKSGCLGSVAIWGKIYEHKLGYRAEWAYPLSLETYGLTIDDQLALVDAYNVSIVEIATEPADRANRRKKTEQEEIRERAKQSGIYVPNSLDAESLGIFYH